MNAKGSVFKYPDNVDTDVIIPARHLNTQDPKELASHCMEDIDKDFVQNIRDGDIMVGGWNFGCGYNLICTDKSALDTNAAEKQLRAWGREPFWAYYSELQYRHVEKKLLVEEYIGSADGTLPEDYKFYCFHGRADCVMLCVGRDEGWPKFYFFDRDFRLLRINRDSQAGKFIRPRTGIVASAFLDAAVHCRPAEQAV